MAFSRLDFPDPLVPRTTVKVPRSSCRSTRSRARTSLAVPGWNTCERASNRSATSGMAWARLAPQLWEYQHAEHKKRRHQLEGVGVEPGPQCCCHKQTEDHRTREGSCNPSPDGTPPQQGLPKHEVRQSRDQRANAHFNVRESRVL